MAGVVTYVPREVREFVEAEAQRNGRPMAWEFRLLVDELKERREREQQAEAVGQ